MTEEFQKTVNFKHDNTRIEEKDISQEHSACPKVQQKKIKKKIWQNQICVLATQWVAFQK